MNQDPITVDDLKLMIADRDIQNLILSRANAALAKRIDELESERAATEST